jgi:alpha-glucosidase (family GH31 glycosyl hydrolase)
VHGGQRLRVNAPIDTIPIFVRAGSIVPMGAPVLSTEEKQAIAEVRVYSGANGEFTLYNDDGKSYAYEQGKSEITHLHWNDASGKLTHTGAAGWSAPDGQIVKIMR